MNEATSFLTRFLPCAAHSILPAAAILYLSRGDGHAEEAQHLAEECMTRLSAAEGAVRVSPIFQLPSSPLGACSLRAVSTPALLTIYVSCAGRTSAIEMPGEDKDIEEQAELEALLSRLSIKLDCRVVRPLEAGSEGGGLLGLLPPALIERSLAVFLSPRDLAALMTASKATLHSTLSRSEFAWGQVLERCAAKDEARNKCVAAAMGAFPDTKEGDRYCCNWKRAGLVAKWLEEKKKADREAELDRVRRRTAASMPSDAYPFNPEGRARIAPRPGLPSYYPPPPPSFPNPQPQPLIPPGLPGVLREPVSRATQIVNGGGSGGGLQGFGGFGGLPAFRGFGGGL